jgi:RNA polymerase sigma-70 factor (ECF subfamily)
MVTEMVPEEMPLEEEALNNLSAAEIFNLLCQLPVGYRTVFNLHVIEVMEHKEIAALMGIAEGTSRSQLSKAKSLLQKLLLQNGNEYAQRKTK